METKYIIELFVAYLLPTFIASGVLFATYKILIAKSNRFQFNRYFLIASLFFSLALPFIKITPRETLPESMMVIDNLMNYLMLDEVTINSGNVETANVATTSFRDNFNLPSILAYIYIIGVVGFILMFLYKLLSIMVLAMKSRRVKRDGRIFIYLNKNVTPFSFLNLVFLPEGEVNSQIIKHELSHVRHLHSFDILFVEICSIIQWFNPFIRLYKNELQNLHEYTADQDVINGGADKQDYMMLILQQCTAVSFNTIGNNFSFLSTKKRIKMITQNKKSKAVLIKSLLTLPVAGLLMLLNCTNLPANTQKITLEEKENGVTTYEITSDEDINVIAKEKNAVKVNEIQVISQSEPDSIYRVVDVQPQFPGGTNALLNFIKENIKYPEKALKDSLQGKVYVNFIVEKDGSITDVKIARGLGGELDAEAIRVIQVMPKWTPGKSKGDPKRVAYILPIIFKLSE